MKHKTKTKRFLALLLAVFLIFVLLLFVNATVGNPVSKLLAKQSVKRYLHSQYTSMNLEPEKVSYNFKDGKYTVVCRVPESQDAVFYVYTDAFGKIYSDTYQTDIVEHFSTFNRLDLQLRDFGRQQIPKKLTSYQFHDSILMLSLSDYQNHQNNFVADMPLNLQSPPCAMEISVTVSQVPRTYEQLAKILLDLQQLCQTENWNVSTYSIHIDSENPNDVLFGIFSIPKEIFENQNLPEALKNLAENPKA